MPRTPFPRSAGEPAREVARRRSTTATTATRTSLGRYGSSAPSAPTSTSAWSASPSAQKSPRIGAIIRTG
uniref:Cl150_1b n=1 Tax=Arundo donax TaxID=35708 RepID=A0A0A9EIU0_ARUDO